MKKLSIYLSCLLAFGLGACQDVLDQTPNSQVGSNNFYRNTSDFQQAVNGIYAQLRFYPDRQFNLSEIRSDNIYGTTEIGVREHEPVNNFLEYPGDQLPRDRALRGQLQRHHAGEHGAGPAQRNRCAGCCPAQPV